MTDSSMGTQMQQFGLWKLLLNARASVYDSLKKRGKKMRKWKNPCLENLDAGFTTIRRMSLSLMNI